MIQSASMRRPAAVGLALLMAVICLGNLAHAQWKWRDAQGRIQYSDQPPPLSVPSKDILQMPLGSRAPSLSVRPVSETEPTDKAKSPAVKASETGSDPALEAKRAKARDEAEAKKAEVDAQNALIRKENCGIAKGQLKSLEDGVRMMRTNEKGEREYLDDAARAREIQRTQRAITDNCNK